MAGIPDMEKWIPAEGPSLGLGQACGITKTNLKYVSAGFDPAWPLSLGIMVIV